MNRVYFNSVFNTLATVVGLAISFFMTPFVLNGLGREAYGVWTLGLAFTSTGYLGVLELGVTAGVVKYVAEYRARGETSAMNELVGVALTLYVALGAVAAVVLLLMGELGLGLFAVTPELAPTLRLLFRVLAAVALVEFPGLALASALEGLQATALLRVIGLARQALFAGSAVVLLSRGDGVLALACAHLAIACATVLASAVATRSLVPELRPSPRLRGPTVGPLVRFSSKVLLLRLLGLVYHQLGRTIIAVSLATALLADYDVVLRLHGLALLGSSVISPLIPPAASSLHAAGNLAELRRLFLRSTRLEAVLAVPVVVSLAVLAEPFIRYWIGPSYAGNAPNARLLFLYVAAAPLAATAFNVLVGMDKLGHTLVPFALALVVNVLASVTLTWAFGLPGVFVGTMLNNLLVYPVYVRLVLRELSIGWPEFLGATVVRVYLPGLAFLLFAWTTTTWLIPRSLTETVLLGGALGAVGLAWLALVSLDPSERAAISKGLRALRPRDILSASPAGSATPP